MCYNCNVELCGKPHFPILLNPFDIFRRGGNRISGCLFTLQEKRCDMNINWKLRLQNKVTLVALITLGVSIIYQVLNLFGIIPDIDKQAIIDVLCMVVDFLALLGIVVDPTTRGFDDSTQAMNYDEPKDSRSIDEQIGE